MPPTAGRVIATARDPARRAATQRVDGRRRPCGRSTSTRTSSRSTGTASVGSEPIDRAHLPMPACGDRRVSTRSTMPPPGCNALAVNSVAPVVLAKAVLPLGRGRARARWSRSPARWAASPTMTPAATSPIARPRRAERRLAQPRASTCAPQGVSRGGAAPRLGADAHGRGERAADARAERRRPAPGDRRPDAGAVAAASTIMTGRRSPGEALQRRS